LIFQQAFSHQIVEKVGLESSPHCDKRVHNYFNVSELVFERIAVRSIIKWSCSKL
jgi:hypothetical protein